MKVLAIACLIVASSLTSYLVGQNDGWILGFRCGASDQFLRDHGVTIKHNGKVDKGANG